MSVEGKAFVFPIYDICVIVESKTRFNFLNMIQALFNVCMLLRLFLLLM